MVERADLERFRLANATLSESVRLELEGFFRSLDLNKPELARDALLEFMPILTDQYGAVAATMAADWYEELRADSGASGRFRATTASGVPVGAVEAQVRFSAGHLWTPDPLAMLGSLLVAADKYVKQPGRDTIAANARREGVKFARVPTGAKTCAFCLTLASRDAVYVSRKSAGDRGNGHGDGYHGDCDCLVTPIRKPSDYPEGYLPDDYYAKYQAARQEAGSSDIKDLSAAMRRLYPDELNDGVHTH